MYVGMKDYQILNSYISFYYHLAYWDRLQLFSVKLYALKLRSMWFVVEVQQKKKKIDPFINCKIGFMLMDIIMSFNRSIKGQFHADQLNGRIKLEEIWCGKMTLTFQMTSSSENTSTIGEELYLNFSRRSPGLQKAQVSWAQNFWTRSKRLSVSAILFTEISKLIWSISTHNLEQD